MKKKLDLSQYNRPCERCGERTATQVHEKFSATKPNLNHYGYLIYEPFNLAGLCANCNVSHNDIYTEDREFNYNEKQFRDEAEKHGYALPGWMKSNQLKDFG